MEIDAYLEKISVVINTYEYGVPTDESMKELIEKIWKVEKIKDWTICTTDEVHYSVFSVELKGNIKMVNQLQDVVAYIKALAEETLKPIQR